MNDKNNSKLTAFEYFEAAVYRLWALMVEGNAHCKSSRFWKIFAGIRATTPRDQAGQLGASQKVSFFLSFKVSSDDFLDRFC